MQGYSGHFVCFEDDGQTEWEKGDVCGEKGGRVIEQCEKDLLAHISLPDLLHNRSGKANSRVVVKLQSWKSWS